MLDEDTLAEIEGDAVAIYRLIGASSDDVLSASELCDALTGGPPRFVSMAPEAKLDDEDHVLVRRGTLPARARWLVGHELAHLWYRRRGYVAPDLEARCDALGAALIVPRLVFIEIRRRTGDDVFALAEALRTTQSLALLRLGEVTGRPAALVSRRGTIVRGDAFGWPPGLDLRKARAVRHPAVKHVAITDEPARRGLLAG